MGKLLGVGPIYGPVGVGASLIAVGGPPDFSGSRKALFFRFSHGFVDIEHRRGLLEERKHRGEPIDTTASGPPFSPGAEPLQAR